MTPGSVSTCSNGMCGVQCSAGSCVMGGSCVPYTSATVIDGAAYYASTSDTPTDAVATDASGAIHVTYRTYDASEIHLNYVRSTNGTTWSAPVFMTTSAGTVPQVPTVMARGSQVGVAWFEAGTLMYAPGSSFTPQTVTTLPIGPAPYRLRGKLDANGDAHLVYSTENNGVINHWYVRHSASGWSTPEFLGDGGYGAPDVDLALTSAGVPVVSFGTNSGGTKVIFATRQTGAWVKQTAAAETGSQAISFCKLVLDASGSPVIAYSEAMHSGVKVATRSGAAWTVTSLTMQTHSRVSVAIRQGIPQVFATNVATGSVTQWSVSGSSTPPPINTGLYGKVDGVDVAANGALVVLHGEDRELELSRTCAP